MGDEPTLKEPSNRIVLDYATRRSGRFRLSLMASLWISAVSILLLGWILSHKTAWELAIVRPDNVSVVLLSGKGNLSLEVVGPWSNSSFTGMESGLHLDTHTFFYRDADMNDYLMPEVPDSPRAGDCIFSISLFRIYRGTYNFFDCNKALSFRDAIRHGTIFRMSDPPSEARYILFQFRFLGLFIALVSAYGIFGILPLIRRRRNRQCSIADGRG